MIEQVTVGGQSVTAAYFKGAFEPCTPEEATHAKLVYSDGRNMIVVFAPKPVTKVWDEGLHPRVPAGDSAGGQFTAGGGEGSAMADTPAGDAPDERSYPYAETLVEGSFCGPDGKNCPALPVSDKFKDLEASLSPEARSEIVRRIGVAVEHKAEFDRTIREVSGLVPSGKPDIPYRTKQLDRIVEKTVTEYAGDPSQIKDLLRATITAETRADMEHVVSALKTRFGVKDDDPATGRVKDSLLAGKPDEMGYADVKLNVRIAPNQYAEIQIMPDAMRGAKKIGHNYYEEYRTILGRAEVEKRTLTPSENARTTELLRLSHEVYDPVTAPFRR